MVAISEILLPAYGDGTRRVHRSAGQAPRLNATLTRDPLRYINGANTYQFVGSDPVGMVDAEGTHITLFGTGIASPNDISLSGTVNISASLIEPWEEVARYVLDMSFDNVNGRVVVGNTTFSLRALSSGTTRAGISPTVIPVQNGRTLIVTWHPSVSHDGSGLGNQLADAGATSIVGYFLLGPSGAFIGAAAAYEVSATALPTYHAAIYAKWIVKPVGCCHVSIKEIGTGGRVEYHSSIIGIPNDICFYRSSS